MKTHRIIFEDLELDVSGTFYGGSFGSYEQPPEPREFEIEKVEFNGNTIIQLLENSYGKAKQIKVGKTLVLRQGTLLDELEEKILEKFYNDYAPD